MICSNEDLDMLLYFDNLIFTIYTEEFNWKTDGYRIHEMNVR
jgi:hypothetical protein